VIAAQILTAERAPTAEVRKTKTTVATSVEKRQETAGARRIDDLGKIEEIHSWSTAATE